MEWLSGDRLTSYVGLFPWYSVRCCYKRPLLAPNANPSLPCTVSDKPSTWTLMCDSVFQPGHSFVGDKWSSGPVRSPTNVLPLSDWIVNGQPCLAIHTFIRFPLLMLTYSELLLHTLWNDQSLQHLIIARGRQTTVACGSKIVGRFDTAINSSSSAALSTIVPSSSEVYLSLSGSWCVSLSSPRCFHSTSKEWIAISEMSELDVISDTFSQGWDCESACKLMDSASSSSDLFMMFLDSLDKFLSLGRLDIVSPDNSSCPGPKEHH